MWFWYLCSSKYWILKHLLKKKSLFFPPSVYKTAHIFHLSFSLVDFKLFSQNPFYQKKSSGKPRCKQATLQVLKSGSGRRICGRRLKGQRTSSRTQWNGATCETSGYSWKLFASVFSQTFTLVVSHLSS